MTLWRSGLLAGFLLGAVASSDLLAEDLANEAPAEIQRGIKAKDPTAFYVLAAKLFRDGRRDEAVFWFYLGQLRSRAHLAAHPDLDPSADPALFGALDATLGEPINRYAFGDIPALVRTLDAVLDWDRDHPNNFTPEASFPEAHTKSRQGLSGLRDQIIARQDEIRAERTRNGLDNR